jgi:biotin-(acetyl-CoA carboxylase) ligase
VRYTLISKVLQGEDDVPDDLSAPRVLLLPPPFTDHWLARGDPFAHASTLAPEYGAGTLVWHTDAGAGFGAGQAGRFDFAVVLEPDTPLAQARCAFILGMLALGDAVAAHCPPERAVSFDWPSGLLLDAGRLGGMRLCVAPDTAEDAVPDWMVLGVELIADRDHLTDPGSHPASLSLKEEDFTDPPAILESFAAYLMLNFDRMTHGGFAPLAARYSGRLASGGRLTEAGDLQGSDCVTALKDALELTAWRSENGPAL